MESSNRLVFVDIERISGNEGIQPMEYAAVAVESGSYREVDSIDCKVQFRVEEANPRYLGVGKFSPALWDRYAIPEEDAATKLSVFLRKHSTAMVLRGSKNPRRLARLAAHNARFDTASLSAWFKRLDIPLPVLRRAFCTMQLAMWFVEQRQELDPPYDYSLETLAYYFSLASVPDHTAIADARTAVELARVITARQTRRLTSAA